MIIMTVVDDDDDDDDDDCCWWQLFDLVTCWTLQLNKQLQAEEKILIILNFPQDSPRYHLDFPNQPSPK